MFKFLYIAKRCPGVAWENISSPLFDNSQLFSFLQMLCAVLLVSVVGPQVNGDTGLTMTTIWSLLWAIPIWVVLNVLLSPFRAAKEVKLEGQWVGNRFIYHLPHLVKTIQIAPAQDGQTIRFAIPHVPKKSFIQFKTEYDGGLGFLFISNHEKNEMAGLSRQTQYGVRTNEAGEVVLKIKCAKESAETICRVAMLWWEK